MEEFVQYHSPKYADFPEESTEPFGIYTNKRFDDLLGSRVWLVARKPDTSEYYLVYWFAVDEVVHGQGSDPDHVNGAHGRWFRPPLRIDTAAWFKALRNHLGNFAFGLQRITNPTLRAALVGLEEADVEPYDDPAGNIAFSMDYSLALERIKDSLSLTQVDLLSALCGAPGSELSAGQIARLLGLPHHAALNGAIVRLAKALTRAVEAEPPRRENGSARWWHVVAEGRYSDDRSRFFWKLRPALRDAVLTAGICSVDRRAFVDELDVSGGRLIEGAVKLVPVNAYERNPVARRRCIAHYGTTCSVCGFDFGVMYGAAAEGIIHVHHLRPISDCGGEDYEVDPIAELRPVCPNCHVVLHQRHPPFTIEELQQMVSGRR